MSFESAERICKITLDPVLADNVAELVKLLHIPGAIRSLGVDPQQVVPLVSQH